MTRYYGPGRFSTERDAMKNLCRTEKKRTPKRRIQVWRMEETPAESFGKFMKEAEEKKDDER